MKLRRIIAALSLVLALVMLISCEKKGGETEQGNDTSYEEEFRYNTFAGVAVSAGETKIEKKESYTVDEVAVSVGDEVKEGDVLFTYDVNKATLDLERAKLELEQMKNSLESLKANKESLEREKAAAPEDMQLSYSIEIRQAEADILEAEYDIKAKSKDIESFERSIENSEEKSPVSGTVTEINRDSNNEYGEPKPFMVITETGAMRIMGYVNENNISEVNIGAPVRVVSRIDGAEWSGTVSKIDTEKPEQGGDNYSYGYYEGPSVDSSSRYPFYVELDDSEGLMLGQHVYIIVDDSSFEPGAAFNGAYVPDPDGAEFQDDGNVYDDFAVYEGEVAYDAEPDPAVTD